MLATRQKDPRCRTVRHSASPRVGRERSVGISAFAATPSDQADIRLTDASFDIEHLPIPFPKSDEPE